MNKFPIITIGFDYLAKEVELRGVFSQVEQTQEFLAMSKNDKIVAAVAIRKDQNGICLISSVGHPEIVAEAKKKGFDKYF